MQQEVATCNSATAIHVRALRRSVRERAGGWEGRGADLRVVGMHEANAEHLRLVRLEPTSAPRAVRPRTAAVAPALQHCCIDSCNDAPACEVCAKWVRAKRSPRSATRILVWRWGRAQSGQTALMETGSAAADPPTSGPGLPAGRLQLSRGPPRPPLSRRPTSAPGLATAAAAPPHDASGNV